MSEKFITLDTLHSPLQTTPDIPKDLARFYEIYTSPDHKLVQRAFKTGTPSERFAATANSLMDLNELEIGGSDGYLGLAVLINPELTVETLDELAEVDSPIFWFFVAQHKNVSTQTRNQLVSKLTSSCDFYVTKTGKVEVGVHFFIEALGKIAKFNPEYSANLLFGLILTTLVFPHLQIFNSRNGSDFLGIELDDTLKEIFCSKLQYLPVGAPGLNDLIDARCYLAEYTNSEKIMEALLDDTTLWVNSTMSVIWENMFTNGRTPRSMLGYNVNSSNVFLARILDLEIQDYEKSKTGEQLMCSFIHVASNPKASTQLLVNILNYAWKNREELALVDWPELFEVVLENPNCSDEIRQSLED